jgi:putative ABC transport system permease protein
LRAVQYPTKESLLQFYGAVEREVRAAGNVRCTAWGSTLPLGDSTFGSTSFEVVGDSPLDENQRPTTNYQIVSPSYFGTLDLPVVAGRAFIEADTSDSVRVCMVNEAFVRRYPQGRPSIGARVAVRSPTSGAIQAREIVGVASQVKGRPDESEDFVQLYVPLAQDPFDDIFLLIRPQVGPAARTGAFGARCDCARGSGGARERWTAHDAGRCCVRGDGSAEVPCGAGDDVRGTGAAARAGWRVRLIAYSVQQRLREFGVRIALGATRGAVLRWLSARLYARSRSAWALAWHLRR